jgi:hypothetical protein
MVILNYIQRWDTRLRFKELLPNGGVFAETLMHYMTQTNVQRRGTENRVLGVITQRWGSDDSYALGDSK